VTQFIVPLPGVPTLNASSTSTGRTGPLPSGTLDVGIGLIVAGITAYAYLSLTAHVLGEDAAAPLAAIWGVMFTAGPGFFLPLEQEVSRAVAARRARHTGAGPLIRQAAILGGGLTGLVLLVSLATSWLITEHLFDGHWSLFISLCIGVVGYAMGHLARGVLSGSGQFRPYAVFIGGEALARLALAAVLAIVGYKAAGGYGLAIGIAPLFAVAAVARSAWPIAHEPGPPAPWSELTPSLGALLAGSVLSQALMNAAMVGAKLLAHDGQDAEVKKLFNGVIVARIPLFLFQAVQAALLPRLSALASAHKFVEFRQSFEKLLFAVLVIGAAGTLGGYAVGPLVLRIMFDVELGHFDVGILALGTGFFIVAMSVAQAMIALKGQNQVALGWLAGMVSFVVVAALGNDLLLRIELAALSASAVSALVLGAAFVRMLRAAEQASASLNADPIAAH
jgi:O-antigen/teichoic acid export membrane protein